MEFAQYSVMILAFVAFWLAQYMLTLWQMQRYNRRLVELRKLGLVSVGKAGSAWRRRQYGVLVVDKRSHRIVHVEQLSGWTVFAKLKPVTGLDGRSLSDITDASVDLPVSPKLRLALQDAVGYIEMARSRPTAGAKRDGHALTTSTTSS